jgi:hypothetical protein
VTSKKFLFLFFFSVFSLFPVTEILTSGGPWEKFYEHLLWVMFVWMVRVGGESWKDAIQGLTGGPARIKSAQDLWEKAGEACKPSVSHRFALRLGRAKETLFAFLLLLLPIKLMLHLLLSLADSNTREHFLLGERYGIPSLPAEVDAHHSTRSWFLFASLVLPGGVRAQSESSNVYVYRHLGLVVKVFDLSEEATFAREVLAYQACKDLQGSTIPIFYGSGRAESSRRPFLVVSYVGERVEEFTPELMYVVYLFSLLLPDLF